MSIKLALHELKEQLEKLAAENEQAVHEKCAQVLLAANGLEALRKKIGLNNNATPQVEE